MKTSLCQTSDIAIVGAGPIGLSMAKALSDLGLSIVLIERQSQESVANPAPDGREIAITHRTKAFMQDLHQWQRIDPKHQHLLKKAEVYNGTSPFALGFDAPKSVGGKPIETLGYLVSNHRIRQAAYEALYDRTDPNLVSLFGVGVRAVQRFHTHVSLLLDNGETVRTSLVIAADSRRSALRQAFGIATDMHDFGRTVMVFATTHTQSNQQTAHEGFYYGKTLAVLPLGEYRSSMVITVDNAQVDTIKAMNDAQLAQEMQSWLGGRLGAMTVDSPIYSYPLVGVHARRFYGERVALIGDTAVGMHPVTAHGYNLGMEGVDLLSRQIIQAVAKGDDVAKTSYLRHYSHLHTLKTRPMYHGTNAIVKLYTDENLPAKALRHAGLRFGQGFLPIKKLITDQLTG